MKKYIFIMAALMWAGATWASDLPPNLLVKEISTGASKACHESVVGDTRLNWSHPLWVTNVSAQSANVGCSADIDSSSNGTKSFGLVVTNTRNDNRTVSCRAYFNTGGGGVVTVDRHVIIGPYKNTRIYWYPQDIGKSSFAGQVGVVCALPSAMRIQWVFVQNGHGS